MAFSHEERNFIEAYRTRTMDEPLLEIARRAGWNCQDTARAKRNIRYLMRKPGFQTALDHPTEPRGKHGKRPKVTPEFLLHRARDIVLDPLTPKGEMLKALRFLAEMTPGALVPLGVNLSGRLGIEDFVRAAGGAPEEKPRPSYQESPPLPN